MRIDRENIDKVAATNVLLCLLKIASIFKDRRRYKDSLEYYEEAVEFSHEYRDKLDNMDILDAMARFHNMKEFQDEETWSKKDLLGLSSKDLLAL